MLKRRFSQHLIKDKNIIKKIVHITAIGEDDTIIEIGAGQGDLTEYLAQKARSVYAIEIDKSFHKNLHALEKRHKNLIVLYQDVLKIPFESVCKGQKCKVIGNIPYNITGQILFKIFQERQCISHAYFTLQKEVAQRITSPPNKRSYGALSAITQLLSTVRILFYLKPSVFIPPPNVESAFLAVEFKKEAERFPDGLIQFITICFRNKRKFMTYTLNKHFGRERTEDLYNYMGFAHTIRAENIDPRIFLDMYQYMEKQ